MPVPVASKMPQIALQARPQSMGVFRSILPDAVINRFVEKSGIVFRKRAYTPLVTFWGMIAQCLDCDHSCTSATARIVDWRLTRKAPGQRRNRRVGDPSPDSGSFIRARQRLPEQLLPEMTRRVGRELLERVADEDKMWKRNVFLVDGTTVSMPDEAKLTEHFGKGSGGVKRTEHTFPQARVVGLISLATGAVMDAAIGSYDDSEHALFHRICTGDGELLRDSVIVGDSLFGSYPHLALLKAQSMDLISRPYGNRKIDLRKARRLGPGDYLITWKRDTKSWPPWLDRATPLPDEITLRVIKVRTPLRGNRSKNILIVTTLTDPLKYKADDIAALYLRRWEIELDLRHIKSVLGMDVLTGKSPDIVRKEIWAYLATYNLIRTVMWEAGTSHDISPCGLEFHRDPPTAQYLIAANRKRPLFEIGD